MENISSVLNKRFTKKLLDHYSFLNWRLPILGDTVDIHFQALLLTRYGDAQLWGSVPVERRALYLLGTFMSS